MSGALAATRHGGASANEGTKRPAPTIVFQGDEDRVVHPSNALGFLDRLRGPGSSTLSSRTLLGSAGGRDFTRTLHRIAGDEVMLERVDDSPWRACVVRRQPRGIAYRPGRTERLARDDPLLPHAAQKTVRAQSRRARNMSIIHSKDRAAFCRTR